MCSADITKLQPPPAGFGKCGVCPYVNNHSASICYPCARRTMERLAPEETRCQICDQPYKTDDSDDCGNPVCIMSQRWFKRNYAITMRTGEILEAINRYKYQGQWGWGLVFSRLLVGYLESMTEVSEEFDAIIPSPTYTGKGGRSFDHTRFVIEKAAEITTLLPFLTSPAIIEKTAATRPMVELGYRERRGVAEGKLRDALTLPNLGAVKDRSILVFDDVFTDGLTLREVARKLIVDGEASLVCGVSLTRQPWRAR
jgi:predicted amidophosphoribosyltransferase